jgi:hypothetical protein
MKRLALSGDAIPMNAGCGIITVCRQADPFQVGLANHFGERDFHGRFFEAVNETVAESDLSRGLPQPRLKQSGGNRSQPLAQNSAGMDHGGAVQVRAAGGGGR